MTPLKNAAILLLVVAFILTGLGGWMDMYGYSQLSFSRQHAWNDGLFLGILAIVALLFDKHI